MNNKGGYIGIDEREITGKDGVMNPREKEEAWKGRGSKLGNSLGLKKLTKWEMAEGRGTAKFGSFQFPRLTAFLHLLRPSLEYIHVYMYVSSLPYIMS